MDVSFANLHKFWNTCIMGLHLKIQRLLENCFLSVLSLISKVLKKNGVKLNLELRSEPDLGGPRQKSKHTWTIVWHGKFLNEQHFDWFLQKLELAFAIYPNIQIIVSTYSDNFGLELEKRFINSNFSVVFCRDVGALP